jgi:hypothetical protein
VLIAVSSTCRSIRQQAWESASCEDIWVVAELRVGNNFKKVAIGTVYIPPPVSPNTLNIFLENANNITQLVDEVVLLGDFNLPSLSWTRNDNYMHAGNYNNSLGNALVDFMSINNMLQFNHLTNEDKRILDLVMSTVIDVTISEPLCHLSKVDPKHPPFLITLPDCEAKYLRPNTQIEFNFFKADFDSISNELKRIDWNSTFTTDLSLNEMISVLNLTITSSIEKFVPKHRFSRKSYPPWFNKSLLKLLAAKEKIKKRLRIYNNPRD